LESGGTFGGGVSVQGGQFQMNVSVIGETATSPPPTVPTTSPAFEALGGFVPLVMTDGVIPVRQYDIEWLRAKTDALGAAILPQTWQADNDALFYWSTPGTGLDIAGYSFALDAIPDQVVDTGATSYQYATDSLTEGRHAFAVMAKNTAGNWGYPKSFDIWVDTLPPIVSGLTPANGAVLNTNQSSVEVTILDASSGVDPSALRMVINGQSVGAQFTPETGWFVYTPLSAFAEGQATVRVEGADVVGNAITPLVWSFTVDTIAPAGALIVNARFGGDPQGEESTHTIYVTLSLSPQDATSGVVSMRLWNDGDAEPADWQPVRSLVADWPLRPVDGDRTVYTRFLDGAGNTSAVAYDAILLRIEAPDTWITSGPSGVVAETEATFAFQSSESGAVYQYRFDDEPWSGGWTSEVFASRTALTAGNHYFTVRSAADTDQSGVIEPDEEDPTPAQRTWTVVTGEGPSQPIEPEQPVKYWRQE
jgi:hypothetical protein